MKKIYSMFPFLLLFLGAAAQTTVTLQADKDNTIYSAFSGNSNGAGEYLFMGKNLPFNNSSVQRALVHFNTSGIPANAIVSSATLTIYTNKTGPTATGIEVHKQSSDWGEGTSNAAGREAQGTPATTNDATWNLRFFPATVWATSGGDYSAVVSANIATVAGGLETATPLTFTGTGLVADVQSWINSGATNFGWALISNNEGIEASVKRIVSRNSTVTAQHPVLSVTYTTSLPVSLKSFSGTIMGNNANLQWKTLTESGNQYFNVEHSTDGSRFSAVGRINGRGNSTTEQSYSFVHTNITGSKHYYRLAQYDFDGNMKHSPVILLSTIKAATFQVTPNPATSFISVTTSMSVNGLPYLIHSATGQIVKKGTMTSQKIDIHELATGQYWLSVQTSAGENSKIAFIKR